MGTEPLEPQSRISLLQAPCALELRAGGTAGDGAPASAPFNSACSFFSFPEAPRRQFRRSAQAHLARLSSKFFFANASAVGLGNSVFVSRLVARSCRIRLLFLQGVT